MSEEQEPMSTEPAKTRKPRTKRDVGAILAGLLDAKRREVDKLGVRLLKANEAQFAAEAAYGKASDELAKLEAAAGVTEQE